jgi:hypothetical protein
MTQAPDQGSAASVGQALKAVCDSRSTAELAGVLAHPLCAGPARGVVLGVLGARCKRPFGSAWEFLDWPQANGVDYAR